jgi:predicted dehydrogenase
LIQENCSNPVSVGVVGAGVISQQYLESMMASPDLDVTFIADLDKERAQDQAQRYGVPRSGGLAELLADPAIDIVVNLTVPAAHVDVGLQILEAGKHVWSEKPIALDRPGAVALLNKAADQGLHIGVAPDTVLGPGIQTALQMISEDVIGTPLSGMAVFQTPGPQLWHANPDFLFAKGAGPLLDMGPYYVTALTEVFGRVRAVAAASCTSSDIRVIGSGPRAGEPFPVEVPTTVQALLAFDSGAHAQLTTSFDSPKQRRMLEVTGTTGTLTMTDPNRFGGEITVHQDGHEVSIVPVEDVTVRRGRGVVEMARAIRRNQSPRASGELASHVLDVLLSIEDAAETGVWVEVHSTYEARNVILPRLWNPTELTL